MYVLYYFISITIIIFYFPGLRVESIYRVSASLGDINKLKEEFNKGIMSCDIIDSSCDVINVSWMSSICHVISLLFLRYVLCLITWITFYVM